jgi:hypothetical protein
MDYKDFQQAKNFIFSDIKREIDWAVSGKNAGNFLCALALACYTEFAGGIKRNKFKIGEAKNNFNSFFEYMGDGYKDLLKSNPGIYNHIRCGLAHEFYVKKSCSIKMPALKKSIGIEIDEKNNYQFYVGKYFEDFKVALEKLEKDIYDIA